MRIFDETAEERRGLADLLAGLTPEQQSARSLCDVWSVKDVAAHLIMPLEVGLPQFLIAIVRSGGNFDRANIRLTARQAERPFDEIVDVLRRRADSRFTPPGGGPEAPLTDVVVHGLDIRWPLGTARQIPADRLRTCLDFLTSRAGRGLSRRGAVDGLRIEATDLDWSHGDGPVVSGDADAILLALTGRSAALDQLHGDGVAVLRGRLS